MLGVPIEPATGEPYQGIVPLTGTSLSEAVETYFSQSEQLKTRLWIFANQNQATALFIQELPAQQDEKTREDWQRIEALANTISEQELLSLSCEEVLHRLFNEEQVRLFSAEPISFKCRCSAEKVATTLISLGRETVDEILAEQGEVIADCEFCSSKYHFDTVDIARIFSKSPVHPDSKTQH